MKIKTRLPRFVIRSAVEADVPALLAFIRELAEYEKLGHEAAATEGSLRDSLFGERKAAEALIGEWDGQPVASAVFFHNFSTFTGRRGLYLEDLYVKPGMRGKGIGRGLLAYLAKLAVERGCGRMEWSVLDWNEPALRFYRAIGAAPMTGWTVQRLAGKALTSLADSF